MTLNDILICALGQLSRGTDADTVALWSGKLTSYANEALLDLADALSFHVSETISLERTANGALSFSASSLARVPLRFLRVETPAYSASDETELTALVTYVPVPKALAALTDVPELPEFTHQIIVNYVVARERAAGDVGHQRGADVYFNLYEREKRSLASLAPGDRFKLINRF